MTIAEIFKSTYLQLKLNHVDQPHLEAGWIVEKFAGISAVERIKSPETITSSQAQALIQNAVERRTQGEPLAYILGEKDFYGFSFLVNSNVLIPRPETEQLVDWALKWLEKKNFTHPIEILDMGTGSGCIGLTLLKKINNARLTALDTSSLALEVAKKNAALLDVSTRADFINLDAAKSGHLMNKFDLVLANPPYIAVNDPNVDESVKKFEPHEALYAKNNGLSHIEFWLSALPGILKTDAAVGFEIGFDQGPTVLTLFRDLGVFSKQYVLKDYADHDRFVCGERD